jgi:glycine/D-amino acid oxidase-like deaminating enzyme
MYDAVVIGGGFYGAAIARYLVRQRGFARIVMLERGRGLLSRASYCNQARVHNGYHYPRSYTTAYRSRVNCPRFAHDFPLAVRKDFTSLYAIARQNSKVTAMQFERFCAEIGAPLKRAPAALAQLLEPRLIEAVYLAEEFAFDAMRLREWAVEELGRCGVELRFSTRATQVGLSGNGEWPMVECTDARGVTEGLVSRYVFNCTYSGLNQLAGDIFRVMTSLKHEITEMALLEMPDELSQIGITVMDGSYFSVVPFPARGLHSLSHVRYTPHSGWPDRFHDDPYGRLECYDKKPRADRMIRDAARYLPAITRARYVESMFEVKTVLVKSEADDGRPILFERSKTLPRCYSVLGGKIDNIYDVLERLDAETLPLH